MRKNKPDVFAMTVLNMGNKPSSAIAQICLKQAAADSAQHYPKSSEIITNNSYMDDILGSVPTVEERELRTKEMTKILEEKGFFIKEWVVNKNIETASDDTNTPNSPFVDLCIEDEASPFIETVLGYRWNIVVDKFQFKVIDIEIDEGPTTRRIIIRVLNGFFDPLGLIGPFIVIGKIILRKVYALESTPGWDDPLPESIVSEWKKFVEHIPEVAKISFPRSITPTNAVGNPQLIIFSDGSKHAYGAVAYTRWKVKGGGFVSRLITSKITVAPLKIENIVRLELCSALVGSRLRKVLESELGNIQFTKVIHIVDSEIVHGMVHKESYGFNTFAGNRVGEIHRSCSPDDFFWTPGPFKHFRYHYSRCVPS